MKFTELTTRAREFAIMSHESIGQVRKYSGEPYHNHVVAVAEMVSEVMPDNEIAIAAALLHDVLEDTPTSVQTLVKEFGNQVTYIVINLTHLYTTEAFPNENRHWRKNQEALRLGLKGRSRFGFETHSIKLADLIHNTSDIVANDPKFAKVYLAEKEFLLRQLTKGHRTLMERAWHSLNEGLNHLENS